MTETNKSVAHASVQSALCRGDNGAISERELHIEIWVGFSVRYEGSRAQLEAEGVIPEGTEWPEGTDRVDWQSGRLDVALRRCRPPGMKGPKKLWTHGDWWCLDIGDSSDTRNPFEREFRLKQKELERLRYLQTSSGRAEMNDQWKRYRAAAHDEQFQAFKALIPALAPRSRGRKSGGA